MATATRQLTFWLAEPERKLLVSIASRLPAWVNSNHLTGLGVAGAVGAALSYTMTSWNPAWLALASLMIAVNWFGDSLDGTLARVRKAERPKYGYYLDHCVDAFSTAVVGIGLGLSPYVDLSLALVLVVAYLVLSINVYLESAVFGVFRLAYGRVGPTEVRLILIAANTVLGILAGTGSIPPGVRFGVNAAFALLAGGMIGLVAIRFGQNLTRLARLEPSKAGVRG